MFFLQELPLKEFAVYFLIVLVIKITFKSLFAQILLTKCAKTSF